MHLKPSFHYRILCSYEVFHSFFFGKKDSLYLFCFGSETDRERMIIEKLFEKLDVLQTAEVFMTEPDFRYLCLALRAATGERWNEEREFRLRSIIRPVIVKPHHEVAATELSLFLGVDRELAILLACAHHEEINIVLQVNRLLLPENNSLRLRNVRIHTPRYLLNRFQPQLVRLISILIQDLRDRLRYLERVLTQGFHSLLKYFEGFLKPVFMISQQNESTPSSYMKKIQSWVECHDSKAVSCIDARVLAEVAQEESFARSFVEINQIDLFLPSGTPVQWLLKMQESVDASVKELTLFTEIMQYCAKNRKRVTLVSDDINSLNKLIYKLSSAESNIDIDINLVQWVYLENIDINLMQWEHLENPESLRLSENKLNAIQNSQPDIVLVSLPHPIQEHWLLENYHKLNTTVVGISDALQLYSGAIFNTPKLLQKMGFEWLFHLVSNPGKLGPHYRKAIRLFIFETRAITNNREVKILLQQIRESVAVHSR